LFKPALPSQARFFSASIIDRLSQISTTRLGAAFSSRRKLQRNRGKPKMPQRRLNQVLAIQTSLGQFSTI